MSYEAIAKEAGLDDITSLKFVTYMRSRWADEEELHCKLGYAKEWALRFKNGIEYGASDSIGQSLLDSMKGTL